MHGVGEHHGEDPPLRARQIQRAVADPETPDRSLSGPGLFTGVNPDSDNSILHE